MRRAGFFVAIEGIDGAGKSTLARNLAQALAAEGRDVVATFAPTKTPLGMLAREAFAPGKQRARTAIEWWEFELLLAADRMRHAREVILPALDAGKVVVCDRYVDSGLAYGISCRPEQYGEAWAHALLSEVYFAAPPADLAIFVDVDVETARTRMAGRGDLSAYDADPGMLGRVADAYERWRRPTLGRTVDGRLGEREVLAAATDAIRPLLPGN